MIDIVRVTNGTALEEIKGLFTEYAQTIACTACAKGFDKEIKALPKPYVAPKGSLLLARYNAEAAGCVALKRISKKSCEIKRLYVRTDFRQLRIGRMLLHVAIGDAKQLGYEQIRLSTLSSMKDAIKLYESHGFKRVPQGDESSEKSPLTFELSLS